MNEELARIGRPPLEPVVRLEKGGGQLTFQQWELAIDANLLEKATVTEGEFSELVNAVAHEGEHGKQWFQMAQLQAAKTQDAAALARELSIPQEVAQAAIDVEAGRRPGVKLAASGAEAEAKLFFESVYGAGSAERRKVLKELKDATKAQEDALEMVAKRAELPDGHIAKDLAQKQLDMAKARLKDVMPKYLKLPEEIPAHLVGNQAGAAMAERFRCCARCGGRRPRWTPRTRSSTTPPTPREADPTRARARTRATPPGSRRAMPTTRSRAPRTWSTAGTRRSSGRRSAGPRERGARRRWSASWPTWR